MKFKSLAGVCVIAFGLVAGVFADTKDDLLNHRELNSVVFNNKTFYKVNSLAKSKLGIIQVSSDYNKADIFASEDDDGILVFSDQKVYFYITYEQAKSDIDKFNEWFKDAEKAGWFDSVKNSANKSIEKEFSCFNKTIGFLKKYKRSEGGGREVTYPKIDFHCIFVIRNYNCYAVINLVNPETEANKVLGEFTVTDIKIFEYILAHSKELAKESREEQEAQKRKDQEMENCFN